MKKYIEKTTNFFKKTALSSKKRQAISLLLSLFFISTCYYLVYPSAECKTGCGIGDKVAGVAKGVAKSTSNAARSAAVSVGIVSPAPSVWEVIKSYCTWKTAGAAVVALTSLFGGAKYFGKL